MSRLKSYIERFPRGVPPEVDEAIGRKEVEDTVRVEVPAKVPIPEDRDLSMFTPDDNAWESFVRGE